MRVSIELFLLDNTLMNVVTACCAAAVSGLRLRPALAWALSLLGAGYALLGFCVWPALLFGPFRFLFAGVLALGLRFEGGKAYLRACVCTLLCALLLGGLLYAAALAGGGQTRLATINGVVVGTVAWRIALSCIAAATLLPRMFRHVRTAARMEGLYVKLRITDVGGRVTVLALLDSGNLLVEPVTGLPVVLLNACPGETAGGYPVRYAGVGGEGEVLCRHAKRAQVWLNGRWREIDVMIAKSPRHIAEAQAIIGGIALPPQG